MKKVTAKDFQDAEATPEGGTYLIGSELFERLINTLRYHDNMSGEKFRAPNLGNATNGFLIDELGEIRAEIKPRQTYEAMLKTMLKDKIGVNPELAGFGDLDKGKKHTFNGEHYCITFAWVEKYIVNGEAVSAFGADPKGYEEKLGRPIVTADFYKLSTYWEGRTALLGTPADPK